MANPIVTFDGQDNRLIQKLDPDHLPDGMGEQTVEAELAEDIAAGKLAHLFNDAGAIKAKLADAALGLRAHGFIRAAGATGDTVKVSLLGATLTTTGLVPLSRYRLDNAGGISATPLDVSDAANAGAYLQHIGLAISATQLSTVNTPGAYL
jgi:hypothetical protein